MELPKESRETYHKRLVEHYGDIDSWETDHWKHFNAMVDLIVKESDCENDFIEAERVKNDLIEAERMKNYLNADLVAYKKDIQSSLREGNAYLVAADKMKHTKGLDLEPDKTSLVAKKLTDDGLALLQKSENLTNERNKLMQDELNNLRTFIQKKPVGRPSLKFHYHYQWLDYLVLELGSKTKALNYAFYFPMITFKKPDTLKREYRKYCAAKGEG
jgi:hypothetical protein